MNSKIYFRNYLTIYGEVKCVQSFFKNDVNKDNAYDFELWIGDVQEFELKGDGQCKING